MADRSNSSSRSSSATSGSSGNIKHVNVHQSQHGSGQGLKQLKTISSMNTTNSAGGPNSSSNASNRDKIDVVKNKHNKNIVHRTTSESLRLESGNNFFITHNNYANAASMMMGHDRLSAASSSTSIGPGSTISSMMMGGSGLASSSSIASSVSGGARNKPKTSSFQITSVVTIGQQGGGGGGQRISSNSNDNGDDSADDLDESHAEDRSCVTDIDTETPSFSEDTFSKEDVFFTTSDAIGSAPVIPTSSQYGLAIVAPNLSGPGGQNLTDVHVSVTDAGINLMTNSKKDVDLKDIHHRNERFKVVKIESTEPFRRGRWICMDYLDHSTLQPTIEETEATAGGDNGGINNNNESGGTTDIPSQASGDMEKTEGKTFLNIKLFFYLLKFFLLHIFCR